MTVHVHTRITIVKLNIKELGGSDQVDLKRQGLDPSSVHCAFLPVPPVADQWV